MSATAPNSASRLNHGDVIAAAGALVLLILMFAVAWYGVDGIPGHSSQLVSTVDAWHGLSVIRWLMLLTVLATLLSLAIHARPASRPAIAGARLAVLALGTATFVSLAWRVLIALPTPDRVVDQKLGAFLGVLGGLAIAVGGYEAVREQRSRLYAPPPVRPPDGLASIRGSG
jgi:hypothetical protein